MTQEEIKTRLMKLKYEGCWPVNQLSDEVGLSRDTISRALEGDMSLQTQIRLGAVLKLVPLRPPYIPIKKNKPGHFKRYLIRYYNLMKWCAILEREEGVKKKYVLAKKTNMSREEAGYVCAKLDYIGKRYLIDIFGSEFKKRKGTFGDCYSFEQWVKQIQKVLPTTKKDLIKKILVRKEK